MTRPPPAPLLMDALEALDPAALDALRARLDLETERDEVALEVDARPATVQPRGAA